YNGSPDAEAYHHFMLESTQYCKEGHVPKSEQVFLISHYLEGKAHSYFTQKVSKNHEEWTLKKFFQGLFNYCFPLNYQSQQCDKIKCCYQNNRSISEYVYELEQLYGMVRTTSKHERIIKLWDGFNCPMRRELYCA
ncbi:hypothetical protein GYMLUDRAFT_172727, partial [Collybiopsis luxurians FD-317 M1]